MQYLNKLQLQNLLKNKPEEITGEDIIRGLIKRGYTFEGQDLLPKEEFGEPEKSGFFERTGEAFQKRTLKVGEAFEEPITPLEKGLRTAGQAAGLATDILGEGIGAVARGVGKITPEFIKSPLKKVGIEILQSPVGQMGLNAISQGVDAYEGWKEEHPREAADLEAVVNIASLLPIGKGAGLAAEETGLLGKGAQVLEKSAVTTLEGQKASFIRDLIRPIQTKAVKEAQVSRTTETGKGIFKKSIIEPTTQELKAEQAVMGVPGIRPKNTFQQNYIAINKANVNEAQALEGAIAENNFIIPKKEVVSKLNASKENLAFSPVLVGDAEKTADKLLAGAIRIVNENEGTGLGLLKAKKQFDFWVKSQKPKVFDANAENAFTIANREVRNVFKDILDTNAPSANVKESLAKQSALYTALENIGPKAAKEADNAFGRFFDKAKDVLKLKTEAVQTIAAAVGIGGLGAAATFAPPAAILGVTGWVTYRAGKLAMNPKVRSIMADLLRQMDKAMPTITDQAVKKQLQIDIGIIKAVLYETENPKNK